jgi:hypothetical protein
MASIQSPPRAIAIALIGTLPFLNSPALADPSSGINLLNSIATLKADEANNAAIEQAKPNAGATQPSPPPKPAPVHMQRSRKAQLMSDGQALLTQAEQVSAGYQPTEGSPSKAELQASMDQMKSDLDSMSEMGEMESLRLQMAMDRLSKMMSTLSNLLKKASDTQQGITQNLK